MIPKNLSKQELLDSIDEVEEQILEYNLKITELKYDLQDLKDDLQSRINGGKIVIFEQQDGYVIDIGNERITKFDKVIDSAGDTYLVKVITPTVITVEDIYYSEEMQIDSDYFLTHFSRKI